MAPLPPFVRVRLEFELILRVPDDLRAVLNRQQFRQIIEQGALSGGLVGDELRKRLAMAGRAIEGKVTLMD